MKRAKVVRGTWQNIDTVNHTLMNLWKQLGYFPSNSELKSLGFGGLLNAIVKSHGGIKKLRADLGATPCLVQRRSRWSELGPVLDELTKIRQQIGYFPTAKTVKEMGLQSLVNAVSRYHEGWDAIRVQMGEKRRFRRWDDIKEVTTFLQEQITKLGRLPSRQDLVDIGGNNVLNSIRTKHGGMDNIYAQMNLKKMSKPSGYWRDFESVRENLILIEEKLGHFPTQRDFRDNGYNGLLAGINRHHGGLTGLRKRLGKEINWTPSGRWASFECVEKEIRRIEAEIGYFPTITDIERLVPGIKHGIREYHGGYINVRIRMQAPLITKPDGYWKNFENIKKALEEVESKLGYFPNLDELDKYGPPGVVAGICLYHDGINEVRNSLGKNPAFPSALELRVKVLLNRWVDDSSWVDGGRKTLQRYGLYILNPETNRPLQIDRYYYEARVAIEIQGQQHFYPSKIFGDGEINSKKSFEYRKGLDVIKKKVCKEQGIRFIEIKFNDSEEVILSKLEGFLQIRTEPIPIEEADIANLNQSSKRFLDKQLVKDELIALKEKFDLQILTSDRIRELNNGLYQAIKHHFGGIHNFRDAIGEKHPRHFKGYWTEEKVYQKILELKHELKRWPVRKEIVEFDAGLQYGIQKFGSYKYLKRVLDSLK